MEKSFASKILFVLIFCNFCLTIPQAQAEDFARDLFLPAENVYFSKKIPLVDSDLRIYATVKNNSKSDLAGTVKFFDEKMQIQIGTDQPISVLAGSSDDVFVDFIIKEYGDHPIAVRMVPWEKDGDNPENNKVTKNIFVDYDTDNDGTPNSLDDDDDNDGVPDKDDALPLDPRDWQDTDKDKIGNKLDPDDDNDGLLDIEEAEKNTDPLKYDTDGDGVNDKDDFFPLDPKRTKDSDQDGIADEQDPDDDNDGCPDTQDEFPFDPLECLDTDKDGIGNNLDDDDDNDGLNDQEETLKTLTDPLKYDTDGDGVNDKNDAFPLDPTETKDSDQDGLGDNADPNDQNSGPVAVFYSSTLIARNGDPVEFDATNSVDKDGEIIAYIWDFGDHTPTQSGEIVTHIYKYPGTYQVKLKVMDDKEEYRETAVEILIKKNLLYAYFFIAFGVLALFMAFLKHYIDGQDG